ncbi:hypothetical protein N781_15225 [Pontibacillus halophilus JSM 076056 = DSM 19796]|uniref:Uncharacterized protein n=1 Tax=Pontibacillus halophilus JSM 076056 = DSM 19796 TaxID=1385510 RepID=A0A0A5IA05_9BACI|nr:hypothetical protein [Pontibacillus halophilus]KGX92667.1 hypothetical protein N781_15225 [Pontibacillus halophilus JSM 076056 = DSM 19796]
MIRKGFWLGTWSGIVLVVLLWMIELMTGKRVYTLLLNVDFIPVIGDIQWPIWMEWLFHLIIAWIIAILYVYVVYKWWNGSRKAAWLVGGMLTLGAAFTYFPLTTLAIKPTPSVTDLEAIVYWLIGHAAFLIVLVVFDKEPPRNS